MHRSFRQGLLDEETRPSPSWTTKLSHDCVLGYHGGPVTAWRVLRHLAKPDKGH